MNSFGPNIAIENLKFWRSWRRKCFACCVVDELATPLFLILSRGSSSQCRRAQTWALLSGYSEQTSALRNIKETLRARVYTKLNTKRQECPLTAQLVSNNQSPASSR